MAIVVWVQCDHLVPYGVCGTRTYAVVDAVAAAIAAAEQDGWYVTSGAAGRRILCPAHAGRAGRRTRPTPR